MKGRFKIAAAIGIFLVFGGLLYIHLMRWHAASLEEAVREERNEWARKTADLEKEVNTLEQEVADAEKPAVSTQKITEALGSRSADTDTADQPPTLREIEAKIKHFFQYLDRQPYVASRRLEGGTYGAYLRAIELLGQNTPLLSGETDDLFRLSRNMAHFYRVLGKKNIRLATEVLENEVDILEPVMHTFYTWFTMKDDTPSALQGCPELTVQYRYAAFFLNTLAGRSYLARRESTIRILTLYYCVRILDQANDAQMNAMGINIRPHIKRAYREVRDHRRLADRRVYLNELDRLALKYKMSSGA